MTTRIRTLAPAAALALVVFHGDAVADAPPDDTVDIHIDVPGAMISIRGGADGGMVEIRAGDVHIRAEGDRRSGRFTVDAPNASVRAGGDVDVSAVELGLPFYPGAEEGSGSRVDAGGSRVISRTLRCDDSYDEVVLFYVDRLDGYKLKRQDRRRGRETEFERDERRDKRTVRIREKNDGTVIELSRSFRS